MLNGGITMKWSWKVLATLLIAVPLIIFGIGCSGENPVANPGIDGSTLQGGIADNFTPPDDQVQFDGIVETTDPATRTLTFVGLTETVIAADDCEIVQVVSGVETPLEFTDIQVGDSLRVCGLPQEDETILAHHLRVFGDPVCPDYDVVFSDNIATIDYAAGTFTVVGRPETIMIDENTIIWGRIGGYDQNVALKSYDENAGSGNKYRLKHARDTFFVFTDLQVGDLIEVKANFINSTTLLAGSIKLATCNWKDQCLQFEATLSTIDVAARIVTFDALAWTGTVCPGAVLTGPNGEPLTLGDFSTGDLVAVKGFPLEGDTLQISQMQLVEN
jgi:hypothetical protein